LSFLLKNKFVMIDVQYNGVSGMQDLETFYAKQFKYTAKLSMQTFVYDSASAVQRKMLRGNKFKQRDTVVVEDWDPRGEMVPFYMTGSKVKFNKKDSSLTFYESRYIENHYEFHKPVTIRKFKLIKWEKDRFTLLDKDHRDVRRTYTLKIVKK
jgi:hypothetical protein